MAQKGSLMVTQVPQQNTRHLGNIHYSASGTCVALALIGRYSLCLHFFGLGQEGRGKMTIYPWVLNCFFPQIDTDSIGVSGASFRERLQNYVSKKYFPTKVNTDSVIKCVEAVRDRLIMAAQYEIPNKILNNVILFTRRFVDENELKVKNSAIY